MTSSVAAHIAVCGDTLDVSFVLPFVDFLPPTVSLPIIFKVSIFPDAQNVVKCCSLFGTVLLCNNVFIDTLKPLY